MVASVEADTFVMALIYCTHNVWQALDQKIAFIVENPADTMLFPDFTAIENLCYPSSRKTPYFWINPNYLSSCLHEYSPFFDSGVLDQYPGNMSTQDLHKLVYCRWHLYNPSLVVCVKPFSSVDKNLEEISVYFIGLLLKKYRRFGLTCMLPKSVSPAEYLR